LPETRKLRALKSTGSSSKFVLVDGRRF